MEIFLIVYLIGYVVHYYLFRYYSKKTYKYLEWEWSDVLINIFISLGSWVSVITTLIVCSKITINNTKPPKWL